jgi:transcriptional regulator with XRE-family HTH domain
MDARRRARRPKSIHDPAYQRLCEALKAIREAGGLTQRELAEAMDEARSFVWKSESGERRLDAVELCRWCLACGADAHAEFARIVKSVRTPKRRV